ACARHILIGIQSRSGAAGFKTAWLENKSRFSRSAVTAKRRNLRNAVLEQPRVIVANGLPVDLAGIRKDVREADKCIGKYNLICHRRTEYVGQRSCYGVGPVLP